MDEPRLCPGPLGNQSLVKGRDAVPFGNPAFFCHSFAKRNNRFGTASLGQV
jgi:hypothetical protein